MLGKLMKYDMKYMARILPWIYIGGISLSALVTVFFAVVNDEALLFLGVYASYFMFTVALEAIAVCSAIFMMVRIYKNMFSDEGYLTFTLPVKNGDVLNSKILVGAIWSLFSDVVIIAMIAAPVAVAAYKLPGLLSDDGSGILYLIDSLIKQFSMGLTGNEVKLIVIILLSLILLLGAPFFAPAFYSFCCAVTHKVKRVRAFASVGIFLGVSYGIGVIISVVSVVTQIFGYALTDMDPEAFSTILPTSLNAYQAEMSAYFGVQMNVLIIELLIIDVVFITITAVSWIVANRIVNKKLNLL